MSLSSLLGHFISSILINKNEVIDLDFKSLHYVLTVAESNSISIAAKRLGISQPSLSRYIQNLNESIGTPLFEHREGRLVPTYAGERYINSTKRILALVQDLKNISLDKNTKSEKKDPVQRILKVVCPLSESLYIHPFAILNMQKKYPHTKLVLTKSNDYVDLLHSGQADLAISGHKFEEEDLCYEPLIENEVLLITEPNHRITNHAIWKPGCKHPWVDINLLREESLVQLSQNQRTRICSDRLLAENHVSPKILMQTCDMFTAVSVAATGAGVCFAPEIILRVYNFFKPPACFSVGDPLKIETYLIWSKNYHMDEQVNYFIQLVRNFL